MDAEKRRRVQECTKSGRACPVCRWPASTCVHSHSDFWMFYSNGAIAALAGSQFDASSSAFPLSHGDFYVHIFFIAMLLQSHRVSPYHFHPDPLLCRCLMISDSTFSISCTGRSPVQPDASPNTSQGGSSSSSPLSARGKLVSMVRVFKEDIQKRKEESDRKSGKGASGPLLLLTFCLSILSSFSFFCSLAGARFKFSIGSHRLMCF